MWPRNRRSLIFKENFEVKGYTVDVSMLIWTNFEGLSSLLQKFHFPIEVELNSLQTQKGLD